VPPVEQGTDVDYIKQKKHTVPVPQCFSLPGTAASASIDVDNTVTETLRSAGVAEREIVPRSIAVDELTAESTNQLPQVHALSEFGLDVTIVGVSYCAGILVMLGEGVSP
jgi:hypothetical protein